ncbi:MAG: transglycosylase domain-containing protein [Deltaproteobacteria bacterium]|nr:transglycosylase domain-containing protein [Deltaproteobacteria bacterium]
MSSRRRLFALLLLTFLLGLGCAGLLWRWKAPAYVERRLERITGHRTTVGAVSLTLRLDLVAHDVLVAGASPFDSQILARADRVTVRLQGPGGFWTPSEIAVEGLDIEYLGTAAGDNWRGLASPKKQGPVTRPDGVPAARPIRIRAHDARVRGSIALPHGPHLAFRIPEIAFERTPQGNLRASLQRAVLDAEGIGSLRALSLSLDYDRERLSVSSDGNVSLEVAGGGPLLDGLAFNATIRGSEAAFKLYQGDPALHRVLVTGNRSSQTITLTADVQDVALRPFGHLGGRRALGLDSARASLHASATIDRPSLRAEFALDTGIRGLDVTHPAIDTEPWLGQSGSLTLHGTVDLASGRIDIASGNLKLLAASMSLAGWLQVSRMPRGSLTLATVRHSPLSCASLFRGQPRPVQETLAGLLVDGKLGFSLTASFDASAWEDLKLDLTVAPICTVRRETTALATLLPVLQSPSAPVRVPTKLPLGPFHPDFVPLSRMPRHLTGAFLTSEDSKFFRHHGFDLEMIRLALAQDLQNRSFQRGASTITQQLAKNLFLSHRRTLARKLEEAVLTWRLQRLLSKERVLELYLNVIELGPGIRGVKQAAREYFGKEVAALTPLESAHLAALTPNPYALARRFRDGQVDEGWQERLFDLLGMMRRHNRISPSELATARGSQLVLRELRAR